MLNSHAGATDRDIIYEAFPEPFRIWVSPTKPPQTENGEYLMKEYPDRWELIDNSTAPNHAYQLLKYFGSGDDIQVDCVLFNQLYGYKDATSKANGVRTRRDGKDKVVGSSFVRRFAAQVDGKKVLDNLYILSKLRLVGGHST